MLTPKRLAFAIGACLALVLTGTARAGIIVAGEMTQEHKAQPGEHYRASVVLRNTGDALAEAKVYQTDYSFAADGSNDYGTPGRLPRSNAKWISLGRELVRVSPNAVERIDFDVRVPADKGVAGTYWSMIMVEPIGASSPESAEALPEGTTQVTQVLRYGIQVVTHIGKTGAGELSFTNPQLVEESGKRIFAIDVANSGQRWLRPSLWLELYSQTGNPVGKFQGEATRLYPGTSARFKIDLGQTPNGKYLGLVAADGTGDNLFGANVELEIQ